MIKDLINTLRHLGITENTPILDQKRILLINEISSAFVLVPLILYPEFIIKQQVEALFILFFTQCLTVMPIVFNSIGYTQTAKWFYAIVFPFIMGLIIIAHGEEMRAHYIFSIFFMTSVLFFQSARDRLIVVGAIFLSYAVSEYYVLHFESPFANHVTDWNKEVIFISLSVCILITIIRYWEVNKQFEQRIVDLLKTLRAKNQNLTKSQTKIEEQNQSLEQANKNLEQANTALETMKIELERSNEDLRQFASMASHDLKAPLRNINSFIGLIRRKVKKYDDKDIGEYLDFVGSSAVQMSQLIEDILEYARIGNEKLPFSEVKLDNLMVKTQYNLKQLIKEKNAQIESDALPTVIGNGMQLGLLFQNLIQNGLKYNTSEIPTIRITYVKGQDGYVDSIACHRRVRCMDLD